MDLIGKTFGAWTVVGEGKTSATVLCSCACGRTTSDVRAYDLKVGKSLMCRRCSVSLSKTSHGGAPYGKSTPEYTTWMHMIQRCHNPNNKDYKNYGGRGIVVCEMWRESFEAFLMTMGKRPFEGATIERIDYNKGYEPDNCKWASRAEQNRNTRSNVKLTIDGETKTIAEWARDPIAQVNEFTMYKRFNRNWSHEDIVKLPSKKIKDEE